MLEDFQIRNYSPNTVAAYIRRVAEFAKHFGKSPELIGAEQIREYQLHLINEKGVWLWTYLQTFCGLRFLYSNTLRRRFGSRGNFQQRGTRGSQTSPSPGTEAKTKGVLRFRDPLDRSSTLRGTHDWPAKASLDRLAAHLLPCRQTVSRHDCLTDRFSKEVCRWRSPKRRLLRWRCPHLRRARQRRSSL